MSETDNHQKPSSSEQDGETPLQSLVHPDTLWSMSTLSITVTGSENRTVHVGAPHEYHGIILDFNRLGRELRRTGARASQNHSKEFLKRLAKIRATGRQPADHSLFWCLGVRRVLRAFSLTLSNLEPYSKLSPIDLVQAGFAPSEMELRCLASWACRHSRIEPEVRDICMQIRNKVSQSETQPSRDKNAPVYYFPSVQARAWIGWIELAAKANIPLPEGIMGTTELHRDRWQHLSFGPDDAAALLGHDEIARDTLERRARSTHAARYKALREREKGRTFQ